VISTILPDRLVSWRSTPYLANDRDDRRLQELEAEQIRLAERMKELNAEAAHTDAWVTACDTKLVCDPSVNNDDDKVCVCSYDV
jgi:hypothetical protein